MAADGVGASGPRGPRISGAFGTFWTWLRERGRAVNVVNVERFFKYVFLIFWVAVTTTVVFDAYSFYVARRDIDSELRSKKDKAPSSLEYLSVLSQRKRALAITSLQGRCMERTQLTLFRIFDAEHNRLKAVYREMMKIKNEMVNVIAAPPSRGLIDVDKAQEFFNFQGFTLAEFDDYIRPLKPEIAADVNYKHLKDSLEMLRKQYTDVAVANAPLRSEIENLIHGTQWDASKYWSMDAIQKLAQRNLQVRKELEETKAKYSDIEDLMARYGVWTDALTGGAANNPVLDEMAYTFEQADKDSLEKPDCAAFNKYYEAVNDRVLQQDPLQGQSLKGLHWLDLTWRQEIQSIPRFYGQFLQTYFNQPPAAQNPVRDHGSRRLGRIDLERAENVESGMVVAAGRPALGRDRGRPAVGSARGFRHLPGRQLRPPPRRRQQRGAAAVRLFHRPARFHLGPVV
jgi:hypothetical protein